MALTVSINTDTQKHVAAHFSKNTAATMAGNNFDVSLFKKKSSACCSLGGAMV